MDFQLNTPPVEPIDDPNIKLNTPPVATIDDFNIEFNSWLNVSGLLSYWDDEGIPDYDKYSSPRKYQFWDGGTDAEQRLFRDAEQCAPLCRHCHRRWRPPTSTTF